MCAGVFTCIQWYRPISIEANLHLKVRSHGYIVTKMKVVFMIESDFEKSQIFLMIDDVDYRPWLETIDHHAHYKP